MRRDKRRAALQAKRGERGRCGLDLQPSVAPATWAALPTYGEPALAEQHYARRSKGLRRK